MNFQNALLCFITVFALPVSTTIAQDGITVEQTAFFESNIRPVLVRECFGCHSDRTGKIRGGLRLDTRQLMLVGGDSGPAIVPGDPENSLLYTAMLHEDLVMPPKRMLSDSVIADFRAWIEMGAPDPRETPVAPVQATVTRADVRRARESFWAYQPVDSVEAPEVEDESWPRTDVDRFVLAKLEQAEVEPAADDEPYRVLRRLSFDLLGLPPTLEQIDYFEQLWSEDPDAAIQQVVDYYLEQPQFGEKWGRHWLDVARYAESTGNAVNITYPHAWRYRDYVIDAFNNDKPFNQFVKEQVAGDLIPAKTDEIWAEQLVATTFLAIGPKNVNEMNTAQFRADLVDEQVDVTSRVFLGMSLACARCHDHKFDAIPQSDYYAMAGFFESTDTFYGNPARQTNPMVQQDNGILQYPIDAPGPGQRVYSAEELQELKDNLESLLNEQRENRASGGPSFAGIQKMIYAGQLENELASLDASGNPISFCMGVQCSNSPGDATLLYHGEVDQPGEVIPRGFPGVVSTRSPRIDRERSGRQELAEWIADERNPLTARVMVNRIWQHLIGRGIVASPNDFGITGQPPSHPELLDYLAEKFVDSNWSVKTLVREIAVSRVYRMRSEMNEEAFTFDPTNSLLWRSHPRRLDAETIRDNMLSVSGQLDLERPLGSEVALAGFVRVRNGIMEELSMGIGGMAGRGRMGGMGMSSGGMAGPMQRGGTGQGGPMGPGANRGQRGMGRGGPGMGRMRGGNDRADGDAYGQQTASTSEQPRLDMVHATFRSVYLPHVRNETPRSLDVFDAADSNAIIGARSISDTADQALYLMNNPFVINQSKAFAERLESATRNKDEQIQLAFLLAYGRTPLPEEHRAAAQLLRDLGNNSHGLALLCQSLFASAEFRYVY
ncbi:MAG: PSD1 and planctomycete cytochrome C domain-containing protein [Planctomycetota bacterium]